MTIGADEIADQRLTLPDGRPLGFRVYGDPLGAPMLFLHGTPGSRLKFAIAHEAGVSLGLAIVAPDRWGYGLTAAPARPSLSAFADDMAALMDQLGRDRFAVGGISGGGPYAAAVAACLAPRVAALALVSPVGPIADAGLGPSLPLLHRLCFTVLPSRPRTVSTAMRAFRWRSGRGRRRPYPEQAEQASDPIGHAGAKPGRPVRQDRLARPPLRLGRLGFRSLLVGVLARRHREARRPRGTIECFHSHHAPTRKPTFALPALGLAVAFASPIAVNR